jgi:hypothetical protein
LAVDNDKQKLSLYHVVIRNETGAGDLYSRRAGFSIATERAPQVTIAARDPRCATEQELYSGNEPWRINKKEGHTHVCQHGGATQACGVFPGWRYGRITERRRITTSTAKESPELYGWRITVLRHHQAITRSLFFPGRGFIILFKLTRNGTKRSSTASRRIFAPFSEVQASSVGLVALLDNETQSTKHTYIIT